MISWDLLTQEQQAAAIITASVAIDRFEGLDTLVAKTLLAVAGAESGYRADAAGDWANSGIRCNGFKSWGLWQINMDAHPGLLCEKSGIDIAVDPCGVAQWLSVPFNNAFIARQVYSASGLGAWSAYNNLSYGEWTEVAERAWIEAVVLQPTLHIHIWPLFIIPVGFLLLREICDMIHYGRSEQGRTRKLTPRHLSPPSPLTRR